MQVKDGALKHARKLLAIGCFCIGTNQVDLEVSIWQILHGSGFVVSTFYSLHAGWQRARCSAPNQCLGLAMWDVCSGHQQGNCCVGVWKPRYHGDKQQGFRL